MRRSRAYAVSSDCCTQSFFPSVERLNNRLRESLHTNRASFTLALLGRASVRKISNTAKSRNFNRKLIIGDFDGEYGPLTEHTLQGYLSAQLIHSMFYNREANA